MSNDSPPNSDTFADCSLPQVDCLGTLLVPLKSGEWELIVNAQGEILLANLAPDLRTGELQRYLLKIGDVGDEFDDQQDMIEGINMIRSQGQSSANPN